MSEVTLAQVLEARDKRASQQRLLLHTYHCPLISFTMNIAGPVKISPLIERAFTVGLRELDCNLPNHLIRHRSTHMDLTGCQAMYAVDLDAMALKKICTALEDQSPLGRLFDMDVITTDGEKLDRSAVAGHSRNCIVCGAAGRVCAARRLHTVPQLQSATRSIMEAHFLAADPEHIAVLAAESLVEEVSTTPKPGLVDRRNTGSHSDMDLSTFLASANALKPYFRKCVTIGIQTSHLTPPETFPLLRQAGVSAEAAMYRATGGVNTHKGAIYTIGILCAGLGRLWLPEAPIPNIRALLELCGQMAAPYAASDFASTDGSTHGQRLYLEQGLTGIRGEMAAGLPSVSQIGLPAYEKALCAGLSSNHAGAVTLLHLIANVSDTNLYHRGGPEGAGFAAHMARSLLDSSTFPTLQEIEALDDAFIARNLSPGGCADLLAVTYFLHALKTFV